VADEADRLLGEAIEAVVHAVKEALTLVRSMPADQRAFEAATELADVLREAAEAASRLRGETVRGIKNAEQLSLAALAERIGVSKARAGQLAGPTSPKETP